VDRFAGSSVPSLVSLQRFSPRDVSLPSLGSRRARFPDVTSSMKTLRLPACAHLFPYGFGRRSHVRLLCSCSPWRSRRMRRSLVGPGTVDQPASPLPACCARGRKQDLSGCLAIHPMPLPCSRTPAEPTRPHLLAVLPMLPPAPTNRRPQRALNFEAYHTALASAAYASRTALPLPMQGSLPAGGLRLYREGVEPSGSL
jgi:hypothetical protein